MFEAPVTFIESKKQKTSFEDVDGNKVIGYLEKDSPGTSNNINFPDFNTFSYRGVIRYRRTGKIMILSTRYQSMSNSSVRPQNSPYFCVGQESATSLLFSLLSTNGGLTSLSHSHSMISDR